MSLNRFEREVVQATECGQCSRRDVLVVCFSGGNGEVSGVATVCRECLVEALRAVDDRKAAEQ